MTATRGDSLRWCPSCCRHRPTSEMTHYDPSQGQYVPLATCKRCQTGGKIRPTR